MTQDKVCDLIGKLIGRDTVDCFLICGPGPMIEGCRNALKGLGVEDGRIKLELFGAPPPQAGPKKRADPPEPGSAADVTILLNGHKTAFKLPFNGDACSMRRWPATSTCRLPARVECAAPARRGSSRATSR